MFFIVVMIYCYFLAVDWIFWWSIFCNSFAHECWANNLIFMYRKIVLESITWLVVILISFWLGSACIYWWRLFTRGYQVNHHILSFVALNVSRSQIEEHIQTEGSYVATPSSEVGFFSDLLPSLYATGYLRAIYYLSIYLLVVFI